MSSLLSLLDGLDAATGFYEIRRYEGKTVVACFPEPAEPFGDRRIVYGESARTQDAAADIAAAVRHALDQLEVPE